ncbi:MULTISPECIES: DNA ligase [Campylobacter]|uniref:DNA ligase n=1 Tax=Campylobacter TaxID=194 RepID=UPI00301435CC
MIRFLILFWLFCATSFGEVMLLKEYKDENLSGWVMSQKYDGVRAIWDGKELKSRSGNTINAPAKFINSLPDFALDGELWSGVGEFEFIASTVLDEIPDDKAWENIKYMVFDLPKFDGNLYEKMDYLKSFLSSNPSEFIRAIKQIEIKDNNHAFAFLDMVVANGGEGIVVRDPNTKYTSGRSSSILKIKKWRDSECEIVAINGGKGRLEGKMGSLECVDIFSKVAFKIGSGFSDEIRTNPPKIGTIITYKFQNLTKNNKPRFPIFLRVKRGE